MALMTAASSAAALVMRGNRSGCRRSSAADETTAAVVDVTLGVIDAAASCCFVVDLSRSLLPAVSVVSSICALSAVLVSACRWWQAVGEGWSDGLNVVS